MNVKRLSVMFGMAMILAAIASAQSATYITLCQAGRIQNVGVQTCAEEDGAGVLANADIVVNGNTWEMSAHAEGTEGLASNSYSQVSVTAPGKYHLKVPVPVPGTGQGAFSGILNRTQPPWTCNQVKDLTPICSGPGVPPGASFIDVVTNVAAGEELIVMPEAYGGGPYGQSFRSTAILTQIK
jgi:hypothetical protein